MPITQILGSTGGGVSFENLDIYLNPSMFNGTTIPDMMGKNNFTVTGDVTHSGSWMTYGGVSGYAYATSAITYPTGIWTQCVWFRTTQTDGTGPVFTMESNQTGTGSGSWDKLLYIDTSGLAVFGVYDGSSRRITTATAYNDNKWHHAVFAHRGGSNYSAAWIDGVSVGTQAFDSNQTQAWIRLGSYQNGGASWPGSSDGYYSGDIGIYMLYNRELNDDEVRALYKYQSTIYGI